ncbi:MAG: hypothetical protein WCF95_04685 [bacterium]
MIQKLKLRGHILDSLILSKLLDQITELEVDCYTTDVNIGQKREEISEATLVIETEDENKMAQALEFAKKQGATEN